MENEKIDIFKKIEEWAALLPPLPERIPSLIKMTTQTYSLIIKEQSIRNKSPVSFLDSKSRFDAIRTIIDDELDVSWIIYDQHGIEMKRAGQ